MSERVNFWISVLIGLGSAFAMYLSWSQQIPDPPILFGVVCVGLAVIITLFTDRYAFLTTAQVSFGWLFFPTLGLWLLKFIASEVIWLMDNAG